MNLRKSDKIIALIGAIIIIVAAVAIVLYAMSLEEEEEVKPVEENLHTFDIFQDERSGMATPDNTDFAVRAGLFRFLPGKSYTGSVTISQENLKSIEFKISYEDQFARLLGRLRMDQDTLMVTITDPDGNEVSETITGEGNVTVTFYTGRSISSLSLEAETEADAQSMLEDMYVTKWRDEPFDISVSVTLGEGPRLLPKLRDLFKGDTFDLAITYSYYEYDLVKMEDNNDNNGENPETTNSDDFKEYLGAVGEFYKNLYLGRDVI